MKLDMDKKKTIFFFCFSLIYCFVLIDRSFYNLNGDNLNIATIIYYFTYKDIFMNDFVKITTSTYYLPCFTVPLQFLQRITNDYILTLQIILFIQLFFTLLTTSYMVKVFFENISTLKNTLITLLLTMTLVYLPYGEMVGFGTLCSALARYSCSIFTPLLIAVYYKYEEIYVFRRKVPTILVISAISGVLINLHPPSAITAYFMILCHWLFCKTMVFRIKISAFKKVSVTCSLSLFIFALFSMTYVIPYAYHYYFNQSGNIKITQQLKIVPDPAKIEPPKAPANNVNDNVAPLVVKYKKAKRFFNFNQTFILYSIRQLFFLPFLLPFFYLVFLIKRKDDIEYPSPNLFIFLKSLFLISFIICTFGNLISVYMPFTPYLYAFHRADRFLFLVFELIAVYLLLHSGKFIKEKVLYYAGCVGLIFFWVCLSRTKGLFQYDLFAKISGIKINLELQTLIINLIICLIILSTILIYRYGKFKKRTAIRILLLPLIAVFFLYPVISGGIVVATAHFINSLNGLGSWAIIGKFTPSKAADKITDFKELCQWIKSNTEPKSKFLFFDENKAHAFKMCAMRSGIGAIYEVGLSNNVSTSKLYSAKNSDGMAAEILFLVNKHDLDYVLIDNDYKINPEKLFPLMPISKSKYHSIYKNTISHNSTLMVLPLRPL